MNLKNLTLTVRAKTTYRYAVMRFLLKSLYRMRLIKLETAAKIVSISSRKGWLCKHKIGNGKWKKLSVNLDFEITDTA